ncbi:MAG: hypothetical protein KIT22_01345 [Verrucomicrobiae bacterium]|nr:hypothetical protein [Verrucomicrobiae bacterium]
MTTLIILLAVLNLAAGGYSVTGKRLVLGSYPALVRIRYFAFGWVIALYMVGHDFGADDWLSWSGALLLALGVVRFPIEKRKSPGTGELTSWS